MCRLIPMGDNDLPDPIGTRISRGTDKFCYQFPRAIVAVDTALLTVDPDRGLLVAEMERADTGKWALPGTFLRDRETLAEAVQRSLDTKLGIRGIRPIQLFVFDDPNRDERHWVLSVAHVAVVRLEQLKSLGSGSAKEARLVPVDRPGELAWDHPNIVKRAKEYIRSRYKNMPDPDHLLDTTFTLRQLQEVHEAVAGRGLDRDRFRRKMSHRIVETGDLSYSGSRGRPAEVFRRKTARDRTL